MTLLARCDGGCGTTAEIEADRFGVPRRNVPMGWYVVDIWAATDDGAAHAPPAGMVCSAECAAGFAGARVEQVVAVSREALREKVSAFAGAPTEKGRAAMTCRVGGCNRPVRAPDSGFCEAHATFSPASPDPLVERAVETLRERPRPPAERVVGSVRRPE